MQENYFSVSDETDTQMLMKPNSKTFSSSIKNYHFTICFMFMLFIVAVIMVYEEPESEQHLISHIGELSMKEQYSDFKFKTLEKETFSVLSKLNLLLTDSSDTLDSKTRLMLKNLTNEYAQTKFTVKPLTTFDFLPHLSVNYSSLQPSFRFSKNRNGVTAILGIPTVHRTSQSYLLSTLNDLIHKMTVAEKNDTLIVVMIAETNESYVNQISNEIMNQFKEETESGLIDIIAPPSSYYPDFEKLPLTLSDPLERVRWRSKQSLDFAYLMSYSYPKGMFYVQLEDDILAKKNYLSIMKDVAFTKIATKQQWFVLDFCQLGFIGKMFRCADLPWVIQFFYMFYNDKPVDWLLDGLIQTKVCSLEKDNKDCKKQKEKLWVHNKPSLFQHIGTMSSLKGKVQKLKDKHFGKVPLYHPHSNPPAKVSSSIANYKRHTLKRAYEGEAFFWGLNPHSKDWISFQFDKPIYIKKYRFKSGNAEYPSDKLYNTSVLASVDLKRRRSTTSFLKSDLASYGNGTYFVIGSFDSLGIAAGNPGKKLGVVKELRLVVHNDSQNWIILSEILIEADQARN